MNDTDNRQVVRLSDVGDVVAALPHLLGFHPSESLVLVSLRGSSPRRLGMTMRLDLPADGEIPEELLAHAASLAAKDGATSAFAVIVTAAEEGDQLPRVKLVNALRKAFDQAGVELDHAAWTPHTHGGQPWRGYDCDCSGTAPDPRSTELAAATAIQGAVTFNDREELAGLLDQQPGATVLDLRRCVLDQLATQQPDPGEGHKLMVAAVGRAAHGELPTTDGEITRLTWALTDFRSRDAVMGILLDERAAAAERLWLELVRATPGKYRAGPAAMLAIAAYLRGDGALAGIALEVALREDPEHSLAGLLHIALTEGVPPEVIRTFIADSGE